jgi:predicted house-cleaning NTP pyrophosphatase (Maf/HAM1 superfamily)
MSLILASASPRRQELLQAAGIEFTVDVANVPEVPHAGEAPQQFAERMAREKAYAVAQRRNRPGEWVLAADTVVFVNGEIVGSGSKAVGSQWAVGRKNQLSALGRRPSTRISSSTIGRQPSTSSLPKPPACG